MNPLWQFVGLLAFHWLGDFVLQTHWQASNKSKNNLALISHVTSYTATLGVGALLIFGPSINLAIFICLNGLYHAITDYGTSRWTSAIYLKASANVFERDDKHIHNFFVVIGFDQLIHQATLAYTMWLLLL